MEQLRAYMPYFTSIICALISGIVTYIVSRKQTKNEINKTALIIYLPSFLSVVIVFMLLFVLLSVFLALSVLQQKSRQNSMK